MQSLDQLLHNLIAADATGGEPIFKNGKGLGRVTSGAYGYSVGIESGDQIIGPFMTLLIPAMEINKLKEKSKYLESVRDITAY